jgi:hypothetical protein
MRSRALAALSFVLIGCGVAQSAPADCGAQVLSYAHVGAMCDTTLRAQP